LTDDNHDFSNQNLVPGVRHPMHVHEAGQTAPT